MPVDRQGVLADPATRVPREQSPPSSPELRHGAKEQHEMTRTLWVTGVALIASSLTACGMNTGGGTAAAGAGGGHVVYAEQFPPGAAWAPETDDAHRLRRAGCLETLLNIGYDGELEPMLATDWN